MLIMHDSLAVAWGQNITAAKISKKELKRLLQVAEERGRIVEHKVKGGHDNIYLDDRLFAGQDEYSTYLVIGM